MGSLSIFGVDASCTQAQVQDGVVALSFVPLQLLLADFFTKAQTRAQHCFYLRLIHPEFEEGGGGGVYVFSSLFKGLYAFLPMYIFGL